MSAMGRVVLVDYTPWKRPDPPIPLLTLLSLDGDAVAAYNLAIHEFLTNNNVLNLIKSYRLQFKKSLEKSYRPD